MSDFLDAVSYLGGLSIGALWVFILVYGGLKFLTKRKYEEGEPE